MRIPALPFLLLVLCTFDAPAFAAGANEPPANAVDVTREEWTRAQVALRREDWAEAQRILQGTIARDGRNADAWNLLGYARRRAGNLELAFAAYDRALQLQPDHRGALSYSGEGFIAAKQWSRAEERLATLARVCSARCEEYLTLKAALDAARSGKPVPVKQAW